ncbi:MAG: ATP-dependent Lon protease [Myxococcota bacterium]
MDAEVREALTRQQREALLRQRLRAIRKELGEDPTDDSGDELSELRQTLEGLDLPESVRKQVQRELRRLDNAQGIAGADAHVTRTWLEWVAALPWGQSVDSETDLDVVKKQLDADHHGLEDVKKRILEHIAVLKLTGGDSGTLLCLAGPPGVGKTSLGRSIAEAMGRPFVRVALGGVRDEAEIRGHRRTYVGAVPGRILHALRTAGADNPVFLLDEIDKLATAGWGGSPEAALLEVLDPEQNSTFTDHYLEVPYDLSKVLFICTANDLSRLSPPLRDRLEVVEISGYTPVEKATIARDHLIPEALQKHGVADGALSIDDAALDDLISRYTREAGVRQLKRELARLCRSLALEVARDDVGDGTLQVDTDNLPDYLGRPRFTEEVAERLTQPGVATGLAWTPSGGDILFIETSRMPGKGSLEVTGQLGDVMKESARAAMTYVRSNAEALGISPDFLAAQDVHIHVPAGGIPKDGPSAGVTIFTALTSLLTGKKVRSDTAMTGECTLRGRVLPVGGIKSKVMAAHRAGLTRVILPRACERDLDDVPQSVRDGLEVLLVDDMSEVLQAALAA